MSDDPRINALGVCDVCGFKQPKDHAFHHELCRKLHWAIETIKKVTERVRRLEGQR